MQKTGATIVDAPNISLSDTDMAGDVLLMFYRALGWSGKEFVDPCKVRTTHAVYYQLYDLMMEKCPDALAVGMAMVNRAPGVDDDVPEGKVRLLAGWLMLEN